MGIMMLLQYSCAGVLSVWFQNEYSSCCTTYVSVHNDECKLWLKWLVGSVCFASVFVMNEDKSVANLLLRLDDCLMHG